MVKTCCIKNCHYNRRKLNEKLSLHRFPITDPELLSKWLDFLDYGSDWKPSKHSAICSRHFKPSDFRVNTNIPRLLPYAVPTIKIKDSPTKICNPEPSKDQETVVELQKVVIDEGYLIGDIDKICRLCGYEYTCTLKNIFNQDEVCAKKIFKCLHLNVSNKEQLPLSVCTTCETKLDEFEDFITKVEKAQERLVKQFSQRRDTSNTKEILVEESPYEIVLPLSTQPDANDSKIYQIIFTQENYENEYCASSLKVPKDCPNNNTIHEYDAHNTLIPLVNQNFNINNSRSITTPSTPLSNIHINTTHPSDQPNLKIPIKMEMMTPCAEQSQQQPLKSANKKIEILQDIKIDPHKLDFKCFKSICDDSLLKTINNVNNSDKIKLPNKTTNKNMDLRTMTLLGKSFAICKFCNERFIGKYALNHHIKYLCNSNSKQYPMNCKICKKTFSCNAKYNAHISKCLYTSNSILKMSGKRRRKPAFVMKREIINNCSYLVGYGVRAKQKSIH
ncbi:uncharacterized protein LOC143910859 [Arctopsyche grandis]|uniref:uncharacterized protein LOC143910859 n=1 Tax=Arctopsyche grandis TaxID=121162 RepID=UPI00406D912E